MVPLEHVAAFRPNAPNQAFGGSISAAQQVGIGVMSAGGFSGNSRALFPFRQVARRRCCTDEEEENKSHENRYSRICSSCVASF